jgi:hypothetical protein
VWCSEIYEAQKMWSFCASEHLVFSIKNALRSTQKKLKIDYGVVFRYEIDCEIDISASASEKGCKQNPYSPLV